MQGLHAIRRRLRRGTAGLLPPAPPRQPGRPLGRRTLLAGWFSFERHGATAGDLLARDLVAEWLHEAGHDVDVANAPPFEGGVRLPTVDPTEYDHLVFVCGPFPRTPQAEQFLDRFSEARKAGVNLTMIESLERWQPFDVLWERDSDRVARPDLTFLSHRPTVPVVGVCLVEHQWEHSGGMHAVADAAVERLSRSREMAVVSIDTRLDREGNPLRTPAEVGSLMARMDALITTRLHGTVLSIKHGVPPLVIDPIAGGAKVSLQAGCLGWPACFAADALDEAALASSLDWCLSDAGRGKATECRIAAEGLLADLQRDFTQDMATSRRAHDD